MVRAGWVKPWAWVLVLNLGCAATPGGARVNGDAPASTSTQSLDAPLLARVDGADIWVQGKPIPPEADLTAALIRGRDGAETVRTTASQGYDEFALARLLAAAQAAGIKHLQLDLAGHAMSLSLSDSASSSQLVAWSTSGTLWLYDLGKDKGAALSGPIQPGDAAAEDSWRKRIRQACGDKSCRLRAELVSDGVAGNLSKSLESLQRIAGPPSAVDLTVSVRYAKPLRPPSSGTKLTEIPVKGHLPAAVIQHIVRTSYEGFRLCYASALARLPELTGRVSARFVITQYGKVSNVADAGSDMPDAAVLSCVLKAFYGLEFPTPGSGIVTVVYPIMFSPG